MMEHNIRNTSLKLDTSWSDFENISVTLSDFETIDSLSSGFEGSDRCNSDLENLETSKQMKENEKNASTRKLSYAAVCHNALKKAPTVLAPTEKEKKPEFFEKNIQSGFQEKEYSVTKQLFFEYSKQEESVEWVSLKPQRKKHSK